MDKQALLAEVSSAKDAVANAEQDLAKLLRELQSSARAEKTTISKALEAAFEKLRSARQHLVALEKITSADDD